MPPQGKKHDHQVAPSDILSNLPENLIDAIVMRMPLRDAVRTSILSKKWRYNWCRLPELTLDEVLWLPRNAITPTNSFTDIMYHLLALLTGPITKFTLSAANLGNCPKIDSLICFLSRNGIQHLVLRLFHDEPYKLPSSFYTCSELRHLRLHNCLVHPPPAFKGFHKLVSLELCDVKIPPKLLASLISCSPLLEHLVLRIPLIMGHVRINAPKLRSFDCTGHIKCISFKKAPLLVKFSFNDELRFESDRNQDFSKYFESFPTLEYLHLDFLSVQFLAAGPTDCRINSPLNCLKYLCLSSICLDERDELLYTLCLIRSSPYLQRLQLKVDDLGGCTEIPASFSDVTLKHLRDVKFEGITGTKPEMEVIKILLAKSPVLLRLLIQPSVEIRSPKERLKVLARITKFPRASPKAEVDYVL